MTDPAIPTLIPRPLDGLLSERRDAALMAVRARRPDLAERQVRFAARLSAHIDRKDKA